MNSYGQACYLPLVHHIHARGKVLIHRYHVFQLPVHFIGLGQMITSITGHCGLSTISYHVL